MIIWATLLRRLRHRLKYRKTFAELSRLDDRMLRDINLTRGEIEGVARRASFAHEPA